MNLPLLSLRLRLALAKFSRYSNSGMDDRRKWDRVVGDLEEIIGSSYSDGLRSSAVLPRTNPLGVGVSFIQGLPQRAQVKSGDR